jgi:hypothetical protein
MAETMRTAILRKYRTEFRFLETQFGFRFRYEAGSLYEAAVYRNETTAIEINYEWREPWPWITIYRPLRGGMMPVTDRQIRSHCCDLLALITLRRPSLAARLEAERTSGPDRGTVGRVLGHYAEFLKECATDVLSGDFTVFPQLRETHRRLLRDSLKSFREQINAPRADRMH